MNVTVCQSCGMPLTSAEQFGTEMDGSPTREYCIYCYKDGKFEQPGMSLEGMVEMCTTILKQEGMDEESARSMLRNQLPYLKRWQSAGSIIHTDKTSPDAPETSSDAADAANNATFSREHVRYVTLPGKRLAGLSARTTNAIEMSGKGSIGALWARYFASEHIPAPEVARYGCYSDYTDGIAGEYTILVGHEIGAEDSLPEGFDEVQLPLLLMRCLHREPDRWLRWSVKYGARSGTGNIKLIARLREILNITMNAAWTRGMCRRMYISRSKNADNTLISLEKIEQKRRKQLRLITESKSLKRRNLQLPRGIGSFLHFSSIVPRP